MVSIKKNRNKGVCIAHHNSNALAEGSYEKNDKQAGGSCQRDAPGYC